MIVEYDEVQEAVNLIHQLKQEGKITVGKSEVQTFGNIRVITNPDSLVDNENHIMITNMEMSKAIIVEEVGVNSYKYVATVILGESSVEVKNCSIECRVYQAQ